MTNLNAESLRSNFSGDILQPGNPGYDSARRIWNASVDKRPALIAQCTGTADVITAVTFARDKNLPTAVQIHLGITRHPSSGRSLRHSEKTEPTPFCGTCSGTMHC